MFLLVTRIISVVRFLCIEVDFLEQKNNITQ